MSSQLRLQKKQLELNLLQSELGGGQQESQEEPQEAPQEEYQEPEPEQPPQQEAQRQQQQQQQQQAEKTSALRKKAVIGPLVDIAGFGTPSLVGHAIGRQRGKMDQILGDPEPEHKLLKHLLIPGYTGYNIGRQRSKREIKLIQRLSERAKDTEKTSANKWVTRLAIPGAAVGLGVGGGAVGTGMGRGKEREEWNKAQQHLSRMANGLPVLLRNEKGEGVVAVYRKTGPQTEKTSAAGSGILKELHLPFSTASNVNTRLKQLARVKPKKSNTRIQDILGKLGLR
jgi:hypothetical protein